MNAQSLQIGYLLPAAAPVQTAELAALAQSLTQQGHLAVMLPPKPAPGSAEPSVQLLHAMLSPTNLRRVYQLKKRLGVPLVVTITAFDTWPTPRPLGQSLSDAVNALQRRRLVSRLNQASYVVATDQSLLEELIASGLRAPHRLAPEAANETAGPELYLALYRYVLGGAAGASGRR